MGTRALIIGLDGFDLGVVEGLPRPGAPHIEGLMDRGAFGALRSVRPPATLPNWTTFLTGVDPARHGVFDFTMREGYRVRFAAGSARETATMFSGLDALGLRCACLSFPATWPPEKLRNGVFVSGWDSPVAFEADRSFMWPPSLYDETVREIGAPTFDDVDEFNADEPGWLDRLPVALERRIAKKVGWARWLLDRKDWDVFAIYFGESDTAAHYLWSHHDARSPRRPAAVTENQRNGLARVYRALDQAVGALGEASGPDTEVTLLSDHGSGGSSDKVLHLNRLLSQHGLLRFRKRRIEPGARLKEIALRRFPPRLRERVFRWGDAWLPSRLESNVRFGAIDMSETVAFSDELNYFPAIHLNVIDREPSGIVPAAEKRDAALRVRAALLDTRDPWSGQRVFRDIIPREDLYDGPHLDRAPDLLLDLELDEGYSYNVMPSGGPGEPFRRLAPSEYLGKKGRSLPGSHRDRGFMAIAGPSIEPVGRIDAHIADLSATMLHRLGLSVPLAFSGRVLWEALRETDLHPTGSMPEASGVRRTSKRNAGLVESRLRALGYIE